MLSPAGALVCPASVRGVAPLRVPANLPLLIFHVFQITPSLNPSLPPHPYHHPVLLRLERADPSPQDAGILVAEPPAARFSRGGWATLLFGPNFWERRGTRWGATSRSSSRLSPGWRLGCLAAGVLVRAPARRRRGASADASGGVPVLWRQGGRRRPTLGGGESLSPLWMGAAEPRTAKSPAHGPVAAPLERRRGRRWRPTVSHGS